MQFCYRGAKYQSQSNPVETIDSGIIARFLGQTYTLRQAQNQNSLSGELLKYRGVVYQK